MRIAIIKDGNSPQRAAKVSSKYVLKGESENASQLAARQGPKGFDFIDKRAMILTISFGCRTLHLIFTKAFCDVVIPNFHGSLATYRKNILFSKSQLSERYAIGCHLLDRCAQP